MRITGKDYKGIDEVRYVKRQFLEDNRTLEELQIALKNAQNEAKEAKQQGCSHVLSMLIHDEIIPLKKKIELRQAS